MTKIEEIRKMKADYDAILKEKGKEAVAEEVAALFAAHPTLTAVRWRQYTPYFNDGDVCEFSLHDVYYQAEGVGSENGDYGDGFESIPWEAEKRDALTEALSDFEGNREEDAYLIAFGDHVQITATRDGVEVEEYSHD